MHETQHVGNIEEQPCLVRTYPDFDEQRYVGAGDGGESPGHDSVQLRLGESVDERAQYDTRLGLWGRARRMKAGNRRLSSRGFTNTLY